MIVLVVVLAETESPVPASKVSTSDEVAAVTVSEPTLIELNVLGKALPFKLTTGFWPPVTVIPVPPVTV